MIKKTQLLGVLVAAMLLATSADAQLTISTTPVATLSSPQLNTPYAVTVTVANDASTSSAPVTVTISNPCAQYLSWSANASYTSGADIDLNVGALAPAGQPNASETFTYELEYDCGVYTCAQGPVVLSLPAPVTATVNGAVMTGTSINLYTPSFQALSIVPTLPTQLIVGSGGVYFIRHVFVNNGPAAFNGAISFQSSGGTGATVGNVNVYTATGSSVIPTYGLTSLGTALSGFTGINPTTGVFSTAVPVGDLIIIEEQVTIACLPGGTLSWTGSLSWTPDGSSATYCVTSNSDAGELQQLNIAGLSAGAICAGQTLDLTASGANYYSWSAGSGAPSVNSDGPLYNHALIEFPATLTAGTYNYTVQGVDGSGCTMSKVFAVDINDVPGISVVSPQPLGMCLGDPAVTLSVSSPTSGVTYSWSPLTGLSGTTGNSVDADPTASTTYDVTATSANGCTSTTTVVLNVTPMPSPTVLEDDEVCVGEQVFVVPPAGYSGGVAYEWFDGSNATAGAGPVFSTMAAGTYTVVASAGVGCSADEAYLTVHPAPDYTVTSLFFAADPEVILCDDGNANWNDWSFEVVCNNCTPGATLTYDVSEQLAASSTLLHDDISLATVPVTSASPSVYTVLDVTNQHGCVSPDVTQISVNIPPVPSAFMNSGTACNGQPVTVYLTGTSPWTINIGGYGTVTNWTSPIFEITSPANTTYTLVSVSDASGCDGSVMGSVDVGPCAPGPPCALAEISCDDTDFQFCPGQTTNITIAFSGTNWSPISNLTVSCTNPDVAGFPQSFTNGNVVGSSIVIPNVPITAVGTFYISSFTVVNCSPAATLIRGAVPATLHTTPVVSLALKDDRLCGPSDAELQVTAAGDLPPSTSNPYEVVFDVLGTYQVTATPQDIVVPVTATTTFTATSVEEDGGCINHNDVAIDLTVNDIPDVVISGGDVICAGGSAVLSLDVTASGNWTVYLSDGSTVTGTGSSTTTVTVQPDVTTPYTVTAITGIACSDEATFSGTALIAVNQLDVTFTVTPDFVCPDELVTITATGATGYTWNTGQTGDALVDVVPGTYTVTATSGLCSTTVWYTVEVTPVPPAPTDIEHTEAGGDLLAFSVTPVSGATSYTWTFTPTGWATVISGIGTSSPVVLVLPCGGEVEVTANNGCGSSAVYSEVVDVLPDPPAVDGPHTICAGDDVDLHSTGSASGVYHWTSSSGLDVTTGSTITVAPAATTTYSVSAVSADQNCESTPVTTTVTVTPLPNITFTPASPVQMCIGVPVSITASGATAYTWSAGVTPTNSATVSANPAATTTYTVTGTANGCSNTNTVQVVVGVPPTTAGQSTNVYTCSPGGGSITLTVPATPGATYTWQYYGSAYPNCPIPKLSTSGCGWQTMNGSVGTPDPSNPNHLVLVPPTASASFRCIISNGCGTVTSAAMHVYVNSIASGIPNMTGNSTTSCNAATNFGVFFPSQSRVGVSWVDVGGTIYAELGMANFPGLCYEWEQLDATNTTWNPIGQTGASMLIGNTTFPDGAILRCKYYLCCDPTVTALTGLVAILPNLVVTPASGCSVTLSTVPHFNGGSYTSKRFYCIPCATGTCCGNNSAVNFNPAGTNANALTGYTMTWRYYVTFTGIPGISVAQSCPAGQTVYCRMSEEEGQMADGSDPAIKVFPNPLSSGRLTIEYNMDAADEDIRVDVFDVTGRKVDTRHFDADPSGRGTIELHMDGLPDALYNVSFTSGHVSYKTKVIVSKL